MSDNREIAGGHRIGALWQTTMKESGLPCFTGHYVGPDGYKIRIGVFPRKEVKAGQPTHEIVLSDPYDPKADNNKG